jgi:hypothetical protein
VCHSSFFLTRIILNATRGTWTKPIQSFNAATRRPCGTRLQVADLPADNPQQSEESSHIGHGGLSKCRECFLDGENGFQASVEEYTKFYAVCQS